MIEIFWINLTQFAKIGSIRKIFNPLANLKIKFHFQKYKPITFSVNFLLFDNGVSLQFNKGNELNSKRNQSKPRKSELEREQFLITFLEKKIEKIIAAKLSLS